jgi:hypothetical protein
MSRTSTSVEGLLVQRTVRAPAEALPPMSPKDELGLLEKKAQEKGMSYDELNEIRQIGECNEQVQTRINGLHEWLAAH